MSWLAHCFTVFCELTVRRAQRFESASDRFVLIKFFPDFLYIFLSEVKMVVTAEMVMLAQRMKKAGAIARYINALKQLFIDGNVSHY